MATDVSICSAALLKLGDKAIADLQESTARATICANLYPLAKLDILRRHPWNCAVRRVVLAPLADTPASDWSYQFPMPGDFLRLMQVGYLGQQLDYSFEGGRVLANVTALPIVYVANITEGDFDSLLVNVMTLRMEMELAYPITKSTSLRDSLKQEFYAPAVGVLATAKNIDGQENPPEEWASSSLIESRLGGARY
jgi:hypothetical protein